MRRNNCNGRPVKVKEPPRMVRCRDCAHSEQFGNDSCLCRAMGRRTCACDRYGKPCKLFEQKVQEGKEQSV